VIPKLRALRRNPTVDLLLTLAIAIVFAYGVQWFIVKPYSIPSGSMETTFHINDHIVVARFWYDFSSPQRGDIIVFHPNGYGNQPQRVNHVASVVLVKRLIGMPGEWIEGRSGHIKICRTELTGCRVLNEPYVSSQQKDFGPVHVPAGRYFMMGDNRYISFDSRYWGTISESQMIGRAFATYWPPDRISIF
jgi:signal peptidase I